MPTPKSKRKRTKHLSPAKPNGAIPTPEEIGLFAAAHRLGRREPEILSFTIQELPRQVMATQLGVKPSSVDTYCDRLHKRLKVKSAVGLVLAVVRFAVAEREKEAMS